MWILGIKAAICAKENHIFLLFSDDINCITMYMMVVSYSSLFLGPPPGATVVGGGFNVNANNHPFPSIVLGLQDTAISKSLNICMVPLGGNEKVCSFVHNLSEQTF